jgi:hypothetical protein
VFFKRRLDSIYAFPVHPRSETIPSMILAILYRYVLYILFNRVGSGFNNSTSPSSISSFHQKACARIQKESINNSKFARYLGSRELKFGRVPRTYRIDRFDGEEVVYMEFQVGVEGKSLFVTSVSTASSFVKIELVDSEGEMFSIDLREDNDPGDPDTREIKEAVFTEIKD